MKTCILCQREFQDNKVIEHTLQDVAEAFRGNVVFEVNDLVVYLCEDCEEQYKKCRGSYVGYENG